MVVAFSCDRSIRPSEGKQLALLDAQRVLADLHRLHGVDAQEESVRAHVSLLESRRLQPVRGGDGWDWHTGADCASTWQRGTTTAAAPAETPAVTNQRPPVFCRISAVHVVTGVGVSTSHAAPSSQQARGVAALVVVAFAASRGIHKVAASQPQQRRWPVVQGSRGQAQ